MSADIGQWLEGLGLGQYAEAFAEHEVELEDVVELSDDDLKAVGLPLGPRRRILKATAELRDRESIAANAGEAIASPTVGPSPVPPNWLAEKMRSARVAVEGERKQVTVLFADLIGSTEIIEDLDPEEAGAFLEPPINEMIDAVHSFEGTVNHVLGDGIMAIFGAPIAHEDHALRACRAALSMQKEIERLGREAPKQEASVRARVGLHSGEVVVQAINNDFTISYSAVGVTSHLAARMEQLAAPGAIQLTKDTLRLVEGLVDIDALGAVDVKGLSEPVEVFELRGLSKARSRLEAAGIAGFTPFVGRESELRQLAECFVEAESERGQVVCVIGDAGVGKSRLLMEFRRQVHDRATWVEGHCVSFGQSMAFHPLIDLLRRNFRIEEQDSPEMIRVKVAAFMARVGEGLGSTLPFVFHMLGVAEAGDEVEAMDPQIRRAETFNALRLLLLRAAERKPQVLVFEDLHWSDNATLDFVAYLLNSVPRTRVVLLLTFRTGFALPFAERTYASPDSSRRLLK